MRNLRSMIAVAAAIALPVTYFEVPRFYSYAQEVAAVPPPSAPDEDAAEPAALTEEQLQELVAPIALYPDELLALIGAASLFPLQVVEAERFLEKKKSDSSLEPDKDWDGSVIALLNYPEIVKMMSDDLEWTQNLGTALAYQQKDVLVAIQQLRDEAVADNVLKSDDKMTVSEKGDNVVIEPASSSVIYIPQYPPEMLYEPDYAAVPITYYEDPYPYYYDYDDAPYFPGFWTGAFWGAVIDWNDWGIWGGDINSGIDIDCNRCMNDIDINGKVDIGDIDWRNVDRDKISHFDRNQFSAIENSNIRNNIMDNNANNIRDRAQGVKRNEMSKVDRAAKAKDVRAGGEGRGAAAAAGIAAGGAAAGAAKLAGSRAAGANPKATAARAKAAGANPKATAAKSKAAAAKGSGTKAKAKAKAGKPKAGKPKASTRSKKPSSLGEVRGGKSSKVYSNRGKKSMSRSGGSNRSYSRGGGGRSMSRGGGGRGGGGRGGGGRGGGRR
ncbi:DUF3300 domain-containing protein [Devosia sp. ZB163]|uniref:DUF3300 domain-containing protein n=1 Tax=Devosia sp. ZB163 TaxID=3025938 RepID=UPI00235E44D2|nr:DUF3300 domain-containing protein [Devosia sp. ZB163]MDC9824654.1 DUF3300 domain-containing protein [Devosia sp. ZB163]